VRPIIVALVLALHSGFVFAASLPKPLITQGLIVGNAVNFRAAPSTTAKTLAQLGLGSGVTFLAERRQAQGYNWVKVKIDLCLDYDCSDDKRVGWLVEDYVIAYRDMEQITNFQRQHFSTYSGDWEADFTIAENGSTIYRSTPYYCVHHYDECLAANFSAEKLKEVCYGNGYRFENMMCVREVSMFKLGRAVAFATDEELIASFIMSKDNDFCLAGHAFKLDTEGCFLP